MNHLRSTEHETLRRHLDTLQGVITILSYPPDLMHEVRKEWPQLQLTLRGISYYFAVQLPDHFQREEDELFKQLAGKLTAEEETLLADLKIEHDGLRCLTGAIVDMIRPWLSSILIPRQVDAQLLSGLKFELDLHIQRHEELEDKKLIPIAKRILPEAALLELLHAIGYVPQEEYRTASIKRSA